MVDLAGQERGRLVPLKEIAARQDISRKYLESIMALLSRDGLVYAVHGRSGGYKLSRPPEDYRVGEILRLTEATLSPVSCVEENGQSCLRAGDCPTFTMWRRLDELIEGFFDGIRLSDLLPAK